MAKKAKKKTARGRKQDRAKVTSGQGHEVRYTAKKAGKSATALKRREEGRLKPEQGRAFAEPV